MIQHSSLTVSEATSLSDVLRVDTTAVSLLLGGELERQRFIPSPIVALLASALRINSTVTAINLAWSRLTCASVALLADALFVNTSIARLNLQCNTISCDGAEALARALRANTTLTTLLLAQNCIELRGILALADAFRENAYLRTVSLRDNEYDSAEACISLAEALRCSPSLVRLDRV